MDNIRLTFDIYWSFGNGVWLGQNKDYELKIVSKIHFCQRFEMLIRYWKPQLAWVVHKNVGVIFKDTLRVPKWSFDLHNVEISDLLKMA